MTQQPLFHEDIYEALKTVGQAYGKPKKIGALLWPEMNPEKAGERWANCLNRTRPEKLDPEQVLLVLKIGREIGCHSGMQFIADHCNYRYETIEPEDEKARLQREFLAAKEHMVRLLNKIESAG